MTIARMPMMCARPNFNVIANTLRVHSIRVRQIYAESGEDGPAQMT